MYTEHFGLREPPFRATPDPRFFYDNAVYREAYATLLYGVVQRKGFVVLTGEVGTGKTTLLRRLMDELGPSVRFVLVYNTTRTFDETVELICAELGLAVEGASRIQRLQRLNDLLVAESERGGNVALLIDEAQNLGPNVLENLRLVSNLETATEKLVQIVLVGQPELDATLADPALRQVAQRVAVRYRLEPLAADEIEAFMDYRLRRVGRTRQDLFRADAVRRVAAHSGGVPRVVNILCDGGLLAAYGAGASRVTGALIDEVASYLRLPAPRALRSRDRPRPAARALRWVTATGAAMGVAAAAVLLAGSLHRNPHRAAPPPAVAPVAELAVAHPAVAAEPAVRGGQAGVPPPAPTGLAIPEAAALPRLTEGLGPGSGETVVTEGTTLSEIALRWYGAHQILGLDLVKDLNPHILDLDRVAAGERLWMPALTPATLARRHPDGSYQLLVASLTTAEAASRLADRLRHRGHAARVTTRDITPRLRVHRVLVEELDGPEAVARTWRSARQLGWTPTADQRAR